MLYSIGFFIFSIFYLPTLIFKGKLHPEFAERFARFDKLKERSLLSGNGRIWIQAVSVGEVALCKGLVPLLKEKYPQRDIVISTITKTGNDLAKKLFSKDAIIIYFPLDFRWIVKKAIGMIKPGLYIMIETEIWPNLLKELSFAGIPAVLINGRISDRSIGKYRMIKPFLKSVLDKIRVFCMQDDIDVSRIKELGAPAERVILTGNMKFDVNVPQGNKDAGSVRAYFGLKDGEILFVAGSTHQGEDEIIIEVFQKLSVEFRNLRLLIAPRHVNRADEIKDMVSKHGLNNVLVLDTIGHLNEAYSVAEIVFIGGSLVKHGGHNPIEPASFSKPILFGPYMFNFKFIADVFLKDKAAMQVFNKEDLYEKSRLLLSDVKMRAVLGARARDVIAANKGATEKNIIQIKGII